MSFLVDGLLKSNASYFSQAKGPFTYSTENKFTGTFSSGLKINNVADTTSTDSSTDSQSIISNKRDDVESRASSSLLNSSLEISKRESINSSLASTVNTLSSLNEAINQEVNPLRKTDLIAEADTILSDLNSYLTNEFSDDSNLQNSITVTSLTPSIDGGTFTNVTVEGITSLTDLGISSLDFSDYQTTSDALTSASLILGQKASSYSSSTTTVSSAVGNEISKFNAEVAILADSDKEEAVRDLSNAVATSVFNFTVDNATSTDTVVSLLGDEEDQSTDEEDSNNSSDGTEDTTNLNNLSTNQSSVSYLVPESTTTEQSTISVEA